MTLNKRNKVKLLSTITSLSLIFTFFYISVLVDTTKAQGGTVYTIWLSTDPQLATVRSEYNYTYWADAVSDANSVGVNISFCIGDQINGYPDNLPSTWTESIWAWNKFYYYFDNLNTDIYKNITIGNHDISPGTIDNWGDSWKNHSRIDSVAHPYGNYTWEWGNILFVVLAVENENNTPVSGTQWYTHQQSWFDSIVTNNTDKNILVMCHLPLRDTVNPANSIPMDVASSNAFKATIAANDNVRGWYNGHLHSDNQGAKYVYENCTCIDCDSVNAYGTESSVFLYVQEGNTTVEAKAYNHATNSFASIGDLPTTFTLKYSFSSNENGEGEESQFTLINDGTNGTVFQETTPTFNGTMPENTNTIWLQVSDTYGNWSSSHLVVNLSNISESEFPSHFTIINSTHWSFTLPEAYAITPIKWHWCRFETYTLT